MGEESVTASIPSSKRVRQNGESGEDGEGGNAGDGRRRTAVEIIKWMEDNNMSIPSTIHAPWNASVGKYKIFCHTDIGGRRSQEDRFCVCPRLVARRDDCGLYGVYDGTVGDFASDTVKDLVMPHLYGSASWNAFIKLLPALDDDVSANAETAMSYLRDAMTQLHIESDLELIDKCAEGGHHYAAATSATCLLAGPFCCVGHLGDSRIALGYEDEGVVRSKFLTTDHKPDQQSERDRIMGNGGTVEYLVNHNRKPFIRGGDFTVRKSRGEQPMQLQYSRAFGGKDLKMFGLSRQPDVHVFRMFANHKCLIIASDGLWDVRTSDEAIRIAVETNMKGKDPAEALVESTVREMVMRRQAPDNITAIVIFMEL